MDITPFHDIVNTHLVNIISTFKMFWFYHRPLCIKSLQHLKDWQGKRFVLRGCVTIKVNGHVIDRLTEKIVKNVIKDEIDHNGAYLCDYEYSDHLFHQSKQCFNALKCPKIVKKFDAPPPPCLAADNLTKLIFSIKIQKVVVIMSKKLIKWFYTTILINLNSFFSIKIQKVVSCWLRNSVLASRPSPKLAILAYSRSDKGKVSGKDDDRNQAKLWNSVSAS